MSAAAKKTTDPRGLKRICLECGGRFYDLNKRPITCPSCEAEFTGEIKVKARRGRLPVDDTAGQVKKKEAAKAPSEEDEDEDDGETAQIVSLEDHESTEKSAEDDGQVSESDLSLDDDNDDDDDDLAVDDDLGDINDLEPDAETEEGDEGTDKA